MLHVLYLMLHQPFILKGFKDTHAINYKNKPKVARVSLRTLRKVYFLADAIFIDVFYPGYPGSKILVK